MTAAPPGGVRALGAGRSRVGTWLGLLLLTTFLSVVPLPTALTPTASAVADLDVAQDVPGNTLIGSETPVTVTARNNGDTTAYNLALTVTVPIGVSVSSADQPVTRSFPVGPSASPTGTAYVWENIVDIKPASFFTFRYSLQHDTAVWQVNDTFDVAVDAYVSDADATVPSVTPDGADPQAPIVTGDTDSDSGSGTTTLVPVLMTKSEPSPEGELLRGVHDHQTVYTLSVRTGDSDQVHVDTVEDWLPSGLEFLGCGDADNSSGEEYPGSGSLIQGTTTTNPCPTPVSVETVTTDPDGSGPLGSGVYTHVVWELGVDLPANDTRAISYVAGIPQRENVMTFPGGAPPPTSLGQAGNLDNNTGPFTTQVGDGTTYRNHAEAQTDFAGTPSTVSADTTVQAVDLAVQKVVDTPTIAQDAVSTWTLRFRSSEYVVDAGISGLTVHDTTPDGTCPIDTVDHGAAGCTALTGPPPSAAYDDYAYDAGTGLTALEWDLSGRTFGSNETGQISFSTVALQEYHNGANVQANDSWTNTARFDQTTAETFGPDGPSGATDSNPVTDDSAADQSGTSVQFTKDVAVPAAGQACGDGAALTWDPDLAAGVGPGDRVCFRLTALAPDYLNTGDVSLVDFLPIGFRYESSAAGPGNEVPGIITTVSTSGVPATGVRVQYNLVANLDIQPSQTAQVILSTVLDGGTTPDLGTNGTELTNNARYSFQNSNGEVFVVPDSAGVGFEEAHVTLSKGVSAVDATPYSPPVDSAYNVVGTNAVTYAITVTNAGDRAAQDVEVWDLLPRGVGTPTPTDAVCDDIDPDADLDGTCDDGDGRIEWTIDELAPTGTAGDSVTIHYTWVVPDPVLTGVQWTNQAGVVQYVADDNDGAPFVYVPRDNVSGRTDTNTDRADDTAHVFTPGVSLTKVRTTDISEPGNAEADQATIGEVIHYTLETRQSGGTTVTSYALEDDLTGTGQTIVTGSVRRNSEVIDSGDAACSYSTPSTVAADDGSDNAITLSSALPDPPGGSDLCLQVTFDAVVNDAGAPLPVRPGQVTNTAELAYTVGGANRTTTASVDTQVVEPDIAIDKRSTNTSTVLPGSQVTYQLVVTNNSGTAVSAAKDVVVSDDFSGVPVAGGSGDGGVVTNPQGGTVGGGTITWNAADVPALASLAPGASTTLSYTVQLIRPLDAGDDFTNGAQVTTTSLAGPAPGVERSGRNPGLSTCSPGTCPGYVATDDVTLTVAGPTLTKDTSTPLVTVGDIATYTVRATLPANLNFGAVDIVDDLAAGASTFVRTVSVDCSTCTPATVDAVQTPEENGSAATDAPTWALGTFSDVPWSRVFVITYDVRVEEQTPADPVAGDSLTNTATLTYGTAPGSPLTDDAEIEIAEPAVTLVKNVQTSIDTGFRHTTAGTPARGETGGTVTYRLRLTNASSSWPAYDVHVEDEPDTVRTTGCTADTATPPQVSVPTGGITAGTGYTVEDGTLSGPGDWCLGFDIPVILPGQTVTIVYTLDVAADFPLGALQSGPELINTATIERYFALPGAERPGNPDVRDYPQAGDPGLTDDGHVNLDGGRLGDLVWLDLDRDGTQDPGEPGIPDVDVTITWAGPGNDTDFTDGDEVVYDRTTDASGLWYTDDTDDPDSLLPAGNYRVEVDTSTLPDGLVNVYDADGPPGAFDDASEVNLPDAAENLDQDFGYDGDLSLGDTVWFDIDRSGTQETDEPGIDGATVSLVWAGFDGDLGTTDDIAFPDTVTTTVGSDLGRYSFGQLPGGVYRVTVGSGVTAGLEPSYDYDDGTTDPDGIAVRTLTTSSVTDVDFGYAGTGRVGDYVWFDTDGDGVQDPAETGVSGVQIEVTWSGFGDSTFGDGNEIAVTRTTGLTGGYLVAGVPAGRVRVRVLTTSLPGGLEQTFDLDGLGTADVAERQVAAGESALDIDFGYTGSHEVGDLVWLDVDGDGFGPDTLGPDADPTEPGVPDQRVRVTWAGVDGALGTADDVVLDTVPTGAAGRWTVPRVPSGIVRATLVGGPANTLRVSYDREGARDGVGIATVGGDDLDFDFGLAGTGSLGDDVWLDFNENGTVDAGEPRLPDVDVHPTWAGFDGFFGTADDVDYGTRTTNAQGKYVVEQAPPGRYRVTVVASTLPAGVSPVFDLDGGDDGTALRTLTQGEDARDVDFGYAGTGSIGDFVWWDLDGDGAQDPSEPGFADVGVTLDFAGFDGTFGSADDGQVKRATGGKGAYLFGGLPAGSYRVSVTRTDLPDGVRATADPDGGDDSRSALTLAGGASNLDQDFGYVGDTAIGDLVWRDTDDDGTRQPSEPALAGVGVTVTYLGPDGVEGGGDDVSVRQTTGNPPATAPRTARGGAPTGDDPFYLVSGLAPGRYVVRLDGSTVTAPDAPSSDLDGGDPTETHLTLTGPPVLDADFGVFDNAVPTFDGGGAAGAGVEVDCDASVTVDPFAYVTDANGDDLHVVKGSIEVPADVTAELTDKGRLRIGTTGDEDFTVRYEVADGRGGTVEAEVPVAVDRGCDQAGGGDGGDGDQGGDDGALPGTGADLPLWSLWLALGLIGAGAALVLAAVRRRRT